MRRKLVMILVCAASAATAFTGNEPQNDRGKELVLEACTACHTLERVKVQRMTRDEWRQEIAGMLSEGVPLTDEEVSLVVSYLAQHFGPENR